MPIDQIMCLGYKKHNASEYMYTVLQFVYFLREVCLLFNFWMIEFTIMSKQAWKLSAIKGEPNLSILKEVKDKFFQRRIWARYLFYNLSLI